MIEIRIIEQPGRWLGQVIQWHAVIFTRPRRTLQREFRNPIDAWHWAQRTMNTMRKENPDDEGGDRRTV